MNEDPASERRFVVDVMLGNLAKWLRILGFDTRCFRLESLERIHGFVRDGILVVTRQGRWSTIRGVFCPGSNDPAEQLRELIAQVPLYPAEFRPLRLCIRCNLLLDVLPRDEAFGRVPDYIFETTTVFHRCPGCGKVYWPGSHPKRMMDRLQKTLNRSVLPES